MNPEKSKQIPFNSLLCPNNEQKSYVLNGRVPEACQIIFPTLTQWKKHPKQYTEKTCCCFTHLRGELLKMVPSKIIFNAEDNWFLSDCCWHNVGQVASSHLNSLNILPSRWKYPIGTLNWSLYLYSYWRKNWFQIQ